MTGRLLAETLVASLPKRWDGRDCIRELKAENYHWRQMEWIGWWFEFKAKQILTAVGGTAGPRFGNMVFDFSLNGTWDFKTHPTNSRSSGSAYLNDQEAVDDCLRTSSHVGWIIAVGEAEYDETGQFKVWHDELKGAESAYVREGRAVGRRSRRRKCAFQLREIAWFEFKSAAQLQEAIDAGWLCSGMQAGQQNADGTARRPKYGFSHARWRTYAAIHGANTGIGGTAVQP